MSAQTLALVGRIQRVRAAAVMAQTAETQAEVAESDDAAMGCWNIWNGAVDTLLGQVLSPEGVADLDLLEGLMGGVDPGIAPQDWNSLLVEHKAAQVSRDVMRSHAVAQTVRDQATYDYSRQCDRIMDLLDSLSERLVLGKATMLLAREARS